MTIGKEELLDILTQAVKWSNADQTLVCCYSTMMRVTRFRNFRIHQDIEESEIEIFFKVDLDGKIGVSSTGSLKADDLREALKTASHIARVSPKPRIKAKFPSGEIVPPVTTYYQETVDPLFDRRIENITRTFDSVKKYDLHLAGSFMTGEEEMAVVNSYNDARYQAATSAVLKLIAMDETSSGFGGQVSRNVAMINWENTLDEAVKKCLDGKNPQQIELGRYDCLLEPEAVGEIMQWLGYIGFGAKQFYEKTSFLSDRIGDKIMSDKVTIYDDGFHPETIVYPFDFEGTPKKKVMLIENGIAKGVVYDSHYSSLYKKESTGHAPLPDETEGPLPLNLVMEPGEVSIDEMRKSMTKGISVTRFHYVNGLLEPKEALMTGLTRDGTFLIEDGKIKKPLKNLRFTESILRAFSNIKGISKERKLISDPAQEIGSYIVPAVLIKDFTFTGITE